MQAGNLLSSEQTVTTTRDTFQIEVAVMLSVMLHVLPFGLYHARHVLEHLPLVKPLVRMLTESRPRVARPEPVIPRITFVEAPAPQPPPAVPPTPAERREPNIFMETYEEQTADAPPTDTQFYGTRNTRAANPDNPADKTGDTPYLEGEEDRNAFAAKTVTLVQPAPRPQPVTAPLGAADATERVPPERTEKPRAVPDEGMAPSPPPKPEPPKVAMLGSPTGNAQRPGTLTPQPPAPPARTGGDLARAKSRLVATGVDRRGVAAFGVAESPFGAYDRDLIRAVQSRWLALIDHYGIYEQAGAVTLYFELYDDGSVRNLQRKQNTGGEMAALWCEKAITEAAPFEPLPEKLRLMLGGQPRDVMFTFYY